MRDYYEMHEQERELMKKVRKAIKYTNNGDPAKDVIDEYEMIEALVLLDHIVKAGYAK